MCDKMAISAYILKIVEKDTFLRLQMRAKEMFNANNEIKCFEFSTIKRALRPQLRTIIAR